MNNNIHNPDVLSCLANLSSDEVFTPPEIANAMLDLLPQETGSELAQLNHRHEVIAPIAFDVNGLHRAHVSQPAQTLTDRAFADLQTGDDFIHRQRFLGAKKQAVDFPDGFRQGKGGGGVHEQVNALALEGGQGGNHGVTGDE